MLRYFRRLRKSLIENNQLKKPSSPLGRYSLYAIGEIILVVLGILIALQINNWNESRKEKSAERVALIDLKFEFENNKTKFLEYADWQKGVEKSWATYLSIVSNKRLTKKERAIFRPTTGYKDFKASKSKLNSLLSTGVIDNIKNDSLKQLLLNWDEVLSTFQDTEEQHEYHVQQRLFPIEQKLKPNENLSNTNIETTFYGPEELEQIAIDAIGYMEYQNALILNHHWIKLKVSRHDDMIKFMNQIITQLDSSLSEGAF